MAVDFSRFPIPDLPGGLHAPSTVGAQTFPAAFGSLDGWMRFLRNDLGFGCYTWVSEPGFSVTAPVEIATKAGLFVVVRPQPDGGEPHPRMQLDTPNVRKIRDAGAKAIQMGNEPDNKGEWTRDDGGVAVGWNYVDALGHQVMEMADKIIAGGVLALIPPMNAGYPSYDRNGNVTDDGSNRVSHLNLFRWAEQTGNLNQLRVWAAAGKIAVAVHNRPANHYPPEYPNDPICMADPDYFQNRAGITDPVIRLQNDGTSFDSYKNIDDLNLAWLGRSVPLFGTEAGYTPEVRDDSRYKKIKDDATITNQNEEIGHTVTNVELLSRFDPDHPKRHRPALVGLMFYHGLYAGDSFVEAWWDNKLYGRDLSITKLLPIWWQANKRRFDNWKVRYLGEQGAPVDPPTEPEPPVIVTPNPPDVPVSGDPFASAVITDYEGNRQSLDWLRDKYGNGLIAKITGDWAIAGVWETHGPMAVTMDVKQANGAPAAGELIKFGWPSGDLMLQTNAEGRTDFPMSKDGYYSPDTQAGPYYLVTDGLRIDGIGWVSLTLHDHVNFALTKGAVITPPIDPPVEPEPPIVIPPEPVGTRRMIGIHVQAWTAGCAEWVAGAKPPILKVMDPSLDPLRYVLDRSPETKIVVFRKYYDQNEQRIYLDSGNGTLLANAVYAQFEPCIAECRRRGVLAYMEDLNEMPWDPWDELPDKQARLSSAFADRCAVLGVRPAVLNIAVGNPPGSFAERAWIWAKLYPALYAAKRAGGAIAVHLYGAPRMWEPDPKYYVLRYRDDRQMWPMDLRDLPMLITESGIDGGVIGAPSASAAGWRNYVTPDQYVEDLTYFGNELGKDTYVLGAVIFTAGAA